MKPGIMQLHVDDLQIIPSCSAPKEFTKEPAFVAAGVGVFDGQAGVLNAVAKLEVVVDDLAIGPLGSAVDALLEDVPEQRPLLVLDQDAAPLGRGGRHNRGGDGAADGLKPTAGHGGGQGAAVDRVAEVTLVVGVYVLRWLAPSGNLVRVVRRTVGCVPFTFRNALLPNIPGAVVNVNPHNGLTIGIALGNKAAHDFV